jgi:uncharacterized membrane protein YgdD (TMEM256/DUF423 family)
MNMKKIIAREGLKLLVTLFLAYMISLIGVAMKRGEYPLPKISGIFMLIGEVIFFGYLLYLLIRFIIWAVRTLKDK